MPIAQNKLVANKRKATERRSLIKSNFSRVFGSASIVPKVKAPAKTATFVRDRAISTYA